MTEDHNQLAKSVVDIATAGTDRPIPDYADMFTLDDWRAAVRQGLFNEYDGSGCWVRDGKYMTKAVFDDVFGPTPDGATHVAWFNK